MADTLFNLAQGRVIIADIIGVSGSETVSSKHDGMYATNITVSKFMSSSVLSYNIHGLSLQR